MYLSIMFVCPICLSHIYMLVKMRNSYYNTNQGYKKTP